MQKNTWQNALNESVSKILNKELKQIAYMALCQIITVWFYNRWKWSLWW